MDRSAAVVRQKFGSRVTAAITVSLLWFALGSGLSHAVADSTRSLAPVNGSDVSAAQVTQKKPVILIFTASYGGGHNISAEAIKRIIDTTLEERKKQGLPNSDVEVKIIKSEKYLPAGLGEASTKFFDMLYIHAPKIYNGVWQATMMLNQGKTSAADINTFPFSTQKLYEDLLKNDPVAVYSSHHYTTDMLLKLRKQGKISKENFPIFWMNTDFVPSTLEKWQDLSEAFQVAKQTVGKVKDRLKLKLTPGKDRDTKIAELDDLSKQITDLKAHAKDLVTRDSTQAILDGKAKPKPLKFFELPGRDVEMVGSPHPGMTDTFIEHGQDPNKIVTTVLPLNKRAFSPMSDAERDHFMKTALSSPDLAKTPDKGVWVNNGINQGVVQKPGDPNPVELDPNVKTIFITSGKAGLGDYKAIVERLFQLAQEKGMKLQVVANCGENNKNYNDLKDLKIPDGSILALSQLLDNTKQVDYFRAISNGRGVYIGKSGSQTPQEANVAKSLSVVLDILGAQEHNTAVFLATNGLAEVVGSKNQSQAADKAMALLESPEKQARQFAAGDLLRASANEAPYSDFALEALTPEALQKRRHVGEATAPSEQPEKTISLRDFSSDYPMHASSNTELIYVEDPQVDLALRETLIERAQKSIDMASFAQASDHAGLRTIKALRTAADQGVQVRSIYERSGTRLEGDSTTHTQELLADSNLICPVGVVCGSAVKRLFKGLSPDDFFHMKFTVIDRGLPTMKIVGFGGRNNGKNADIFGDSAFILRPIDSSKPWIGDDFAQLYNDRYDLMKKINGEVVVKAPSKEAKDKLSDIPDSILRTPEQKAAYQRILQILESPPQKEGSLDPNVFHPKRMKLLTNGALKNAAGPGLSYTVDKRSNKPNNFLAELHDRIPSAKSAIVSSYAFNLPEPVKTDLLNLVKRGGSLTVVTNPREVMEGMTRPGTIDRAMGVHSTYVSINNLLEFAKAAKTSGAHFEVGLLDPKQSSNHEAGYQYLHRKLVILGYNGDEEVDGEQHSEIYTGSDNLTKSSARKNDEVAIQAEDARLNTYLRNQVQREISSFYKTYNADEIIDKAAHLDRAGCLSGGLMHAIKTWGVDQVF